MKHLTIMLKPASSLCNLRCKYCFYADITSLREVSSFGVMKESAMTAVMDHIFIDLDDGDYLTLSFQGGELFTGIWYSILREKNEISI